MGANRSPDGDVYERLPAAYPTLDRLREIRGLLLAGRMDGWLLTDFRGDNRAALDVLRPSRPVERRWFYLIPARGEPVLIVHMGDVEAFSGTPGRRMTYTSHGEVAGILGRALRGHRRIAMEIGDSLSYPLTHLDATVADTVRTLGIRIVSSGDIRLQAARWEPRSLEHYVEARRRLLEIRDEAITMIAEHLRRGTPIDEVTVQKAMYRSLRSRGLETESPPAVATGKNTAIPEYMATVSRTSPIRMGDLIVIRLSARLRLAGAPYAVVTHLAYAGSEVPEPMAKAYAAARAAAKEAVALIQDRHSRRQPMRAFEVDVATRKVLEKHGYKNNILHPTGHSLETRLPGSGLSLDDYDRHDTRLVQRGLGLRIAPGVYVPGEFGVRAEHAIFLAEQEIRLLEPGATRIQPLFPRPGAELLELP